MNDLSIYIHIPFCVRKCLYCDFLSFPASGDGAQEKMESYVNQLRKEIESSADLYRKYHVLSIFLGGGTPSFLPVKEVSRIMETIHRHYRVSQDAEITIEMNPETASEDKLREYITSGINRISIGLQSTDDEELARIGRIHDYEMFLRAYELAGKAGFHNINVDLMAALPGQSIASYERTLKRVTALAPEHISAYSLILEEGTPLHARQAEYLFPTEDEDREMYELTGEYLASCGYHRYEISNYALDGCECRHNKVYWQRGNYVGFGLGASSMVENVRWTNPADTEEYRTYIERMSGCMSRTVRETVSGQAAGIPDESTVSRQAEDIYTANRHVLTLREQMEEYMFLGLRMMCGVSMRRFEDEFGQRMMTVYGEVIGRMCRQGLLEQKEDCIRLTGRGIDVSNHVMAQFLFD